MIVGGCTCNHIRYAYGGEPILSYKCHCLDCQAASGAGHVALFWAAADRFRFTSGSPTLHAVTGSSGGRVERGFCPGCGAPVVATLSILPQIIGIVASSLDEPHGFAPEYEVWTSRATPWDPPSPDCKQLPQNFTPDIIQQHFGAHGIAT